MNFVIRFASDRHTLSNVFQGNSLALQRLRTRIRPMGDSKPAANIDPRQHLRFPRIGIRSASYHGSSYRVPIDLWSGIYPNQDAVRVPIGFRQILSKYRYRLLRNLGVRVAIFCRPLNLQSLFQSARPLFVSNPNRSSHANNGNSYERSSHRFADGGKEGSCRRENRTIVTRHRTDSLRKIVLGLHSDRVHRSR